MITTTTQLAAAATVCRTLTALEMLISKPRLSMNPGQSANATASPKLPAAVSTCGTNVCD